ncbi:MAG: hypothetical protein GY731_09035, partial [Gammaproteobacteria bacterium]|nr:hypothetical protein [Gammaproteobacteria bacterium]
MMRYPRLLSLLAIWCFFTLATVVSAAPDMDGSGEETEIGFWERSRGTVGDIWEKTLNAFRGSPEEELFAHLWKSMLPRMDSVLALEDRHASLPEQAWFGEDQQSNQAAIGDLLDESINILSDSNGSGYRERIRVVSGAIRSARSEISRLRDARVTAPADSMWQRTMEQYKAEIHKQQALIAQYQLEHAAIRRDFATDLRRQGLNISDEQLEFLLATVVGDHLVRLSEVFYNVKLLTVQLERLMLESHEDLSLARRYYGMYTVLL